MSNVKELAKEVFEGRKAITETIKENPIIRETVAKYAKQLLNVFKVSNEQQQSAIWIWQLKIVFNSYFENLSIYFAIKREDDALFYNETFLKTEISNGIIKGKNEDLLKAIEEIQIPKSVFDLLCDYCKENLTEYFKVKMTDKECSFCLELKDTICENENSEN